MDHIVAKIHEEKNVKRVLGEERTYAEYCRIEIEYALSFLLGYLWNKNLFDRDALDDDACENIFNNITRPSIGTIIDICRRLDIRGEIFAKPIWKSAQEYAEIRNSFFGHGFLYGDNTSKVIEDFETVLTRLFAKDGILAQNFDLILTTNVNQDVALGVRYSQDMRKLPWQCSTEIFQFAENNVYAMSGTNNYLRISPFIHILDDEFYVYKSVKDILTGRTIYNKLFRTGTMAISWQDFTMDISNDGVRRTSKNGTALNVYEENFKDYIDIGFKSKIKNFLINNRADVCATVWGHGGIGKTATVQSVCNDLSLGKKQFDYIVFASAKDRTFSYLLGNITSIDDPIDSYDRLIKCIKSTIRAEESEGIDEIKYFEGKLLIVIDDYETFREEDQRQIQSFIRELDTSKHKVIITTRAAAITTGERIDTQELEPREATEFFRRILNLDEFKKFHLPSSVDLDLPETQARIHEITSGRPLFLLQFAHTLVQTGVADALSRDFKNREEAIDFLYGRIFSYLSIDARLVFCAAGLLIAEGDLTNLLSKLRYVVDMDRDEENFNSCIRELVALRIIEITHDNFFRIYSSEILKIMQARFPNVPKQKQGDFISRLNRVNLDKSLDVEEALLRRADEARMANRPSDVEAMYREILNREERSPTMVPSRALRNLAGYFWSERDNKEKAIELLEQYKSRFQYDPEVAKMLANLYWQCRNVDKAIEVLFEYFGPNIWERDGKKNSLELLGLWLMFRSKSIIERNEEIEARRRAESWTDQRFEGQRHNIYQDFRSLFNRFGKTLFSRVKESGLEGLTAAERHNIITGLYHFSGACLRFSEPNMAKEICEFALRNGRTGTMTQEFRRRLNLVRQKGNHSGRRRSRFPRPPRSTVMTDAFERARRTSPK